MMTKATLFQYPKCGTCRKAVKWLEAEGLEVEKRHIVDNPPSVEELRELVARSGLPVRKFFNTSGGSYREGNFKERLATMSDDEAIAALAADGMLIKRPILDVDHTVLVGFREEHWARAFGV